MPRMVLYNAFPRIYDSMSSATQDLERISKMGFNAVWLNPVNSTSNTQVERYNPVEKDVIKVSGSLYATYDFSRLNNKLFSDVSSFDEKVRSTGNPREATENDIALMKTYTSKGLC